MLIEKDELQQEQEGVIIIHTFAWLSDISSYSGRM